MKLIHDDALIRTAGIIESWLDGNGIPPVDWPHTRLILILLRMPKLNLKPTPII